ncbi:hypothetical protein N0V90_001004 [Kalmusia sp. IMI 367209]|nr:hypothetical protein N0V90_001004 [Kalmusia sp. IMI 367209]
MDAEPFDKTIEVEVTIALAFLGSSAVASSPTHTIQVFFALAGLRAATTVSVKVAVLFLYKQVLTLDNRWFRIAWWACFLYLVPCLMAIDLTFYGISYTNKMRSPNNDLEPAAFQFGRIAHMTVAWLNTVADMSILILPLPYLFRLRIQRSQKVALGVLLCIGFL